MTMNERCSQHLPHTRMDNVDLKEERKPPMSAYMRVPTCKRAHALGKSSLWLQRESELRETQLCVFGDNDKSRRTSASIRHGYIIDPLTALLIISKEKLYCIVLYCEMRFFTPVKLE